MRLALIAIKHFQKVRDNRALRKLEALEENYDSVSYMIPYAFNGSVLRELKSSLKAAYSGIPQRALYDLNKYLAENINEGLTVDVLNRFAKEQ